MLIDADKIWIYLHMMITEHVLLNVHLHNLQIILHVDVWLNVYLNQVHMSTLMVVKEFVF